MYSACYCFLDVAGRFDNDIDVDALEEELAALMLQDNGEPLPPTIIHRPCRVHMIIMNVIISIE